MTDHTLTKPAGAPTDSAAVPPLAFRVALSVTSLGAAAIHFAVLGEHLDEYLLFGLFFAVIAWLQAAWAVAVVAAPTRRLLTGGVLGNVVVVVIWSVSRTWGVPIGPEAGVPEAASLIDIVSTVLELVIASGCAILLISRARGGGRYATGRGALVAAVAVAVLAVPLSTVAIAPAVGGGHTHASDSTADDHATGDHGHALSGSGEEDPAQIELVRAAMAKYQDVDVAFAEGWQDDGTDWPEVGSHFYRDGDWDESFPARPGVDLADPEFLMYSKLLTGRWKLVAVAYVVDQALYPEPPTDLTGALYHEHVWNCIDDGEELEEEDWGIISREECQIMDGEWSPGAVWMTHVWFIDNPDGVFGEVNPALVATA